MRAVKARRIKQAAGVAHVHQAKRPRRTTTAASKPSGPPVGALTVDTPMAGYKVRGFRAQWKSLGRDGARPSGRLLR